MQGTWYILHCTYLWCCHYFRELTPISYGWEAAEFPVLVVRRDPVVAASLHVQRHEIHAKVSHVRVCVVRILKQVLGELKNILRCMEEVFLVWMHR